MRTPTDMFSTNFKQPQLFRTYHHSVNSSAFMKRYKAAHTSSYMLRPSSRDLNSSVIGTRQAFKKEFIRESLRNLCGFNRDTSVWLLSEIWQSIHRRSTVLYCPSDGSVSLTPMQWHQVALVSENLPITVRLFL